MYKPNPDNIQEILDQWETPDGAVIGTHYCWTSQLTIMGGNDATVNTVLPVTVSFKDWQGNPLPDENRPIKISVTGPAQPAELVLNPVNGVAEFDFSSPVAGKFIITASADFPCDVASLEVTVNE